MDNENTTYDIDFIRSLISKCKWTWAKTYGSCPHEYIYRDRCPLSKPAFFDFIKTIKQEGVSEWFGRRKNQYLYVDGYKYWTMGDGIDLEVDKTINRQKVFNEFDKLDFPLPIDYTSEEFSEIVKCITGTFISPIIEVGFGNGDFLEVSGISSNLYYGLEPSSKAIDAFKQRYNGCSSRCSKRTFEESITKWGKGGFVVIALFGSASYLMGQYLKLLYESSNDYFLMFYNDKYCPSAYKDLHHFRYSLSGIRKSFAKSFIKEYGNYIIVSSKEINLEVKGYDLFSI